MFHYKYSLTFLTGLICIMAILLVVFFSVIRFNPVQDGFVRRMVFAVVPQGWSFFTRSPREAQTIIYEVKNNTLVLVDHRHTSIKHLIGLNRRASVVMSEMQIVRSQLPDSIFITTDWNYQSGTIGKFPDKPAMEVPNKLYNPILCGEFVLVFQQPVPWAWSESLSTINMPAKAARITITCDREK